MANTSNSTPSGAHHFLGTLRLAAFLKLAGGFTGAWQLVVLPVDPLHAGCSRLDNRQISERCKTRRGDPSEFGDAHTSPDEACNEYPGRHSLSHASRVFINQELGNALGHVMNISEIAPSRPRM
jgi:hypothetical protein